MKSKVHTAKYRTFAKPIINVLPREDYLYLGLLGPGRPGVGSFGYGLVSDFFSLR